MIIAVAYTEYQILQIQAIIKEYGLKNISLITFAKSRIPEWLVDHAMYNEIFVLPEIRIERIRRLTKSFVSDYNVQLKKIFNGRSVDLLIGAQDENTIYALIKSLANPRQYWSIEDGMANYYQRKLSYKIEIAFKNILFRTYGYPLKIAFGHGRMKSDKFFRMDPELSIGKGKKVASNKMLCRYIKDNQDNYLKANRSVIDKYYKKTQLIVTSHKEYKTNANVVNKKNVLYKFHPLDNINGKIADDYINEIIPIEILISLLKNIDQITFDVMSSSILNILQLNQNINININFNPKDKSWESYFMQLTNKYRDRIKLI